MQVKDRVAETHMHATVLLLAIFWVYQQVMVGNLKV